MGPKKAGELTKSKFRAWREKERAGGREEKERYSDREGTGAIKGRERAYRERERVKDVKMGEFK